MKRPVPPLCERPQKCSGHPAEPRLSRNVLVFPCQGSFQRTQTADAAMFIELLKRTRLVLQEFDQL